MKVLIFTTAYFPMVGGAEVAIKEVTDRIPDAEFHLYCAKLRADTLRRETLGRVDVHRVGIGRSIDKYLLPILGPVSAFFAMRKHPPDVVWSVMASYGGFAALFYSWLRPKTRFVLTLQEGDPLERYEQRSGIMNGLRKRIFQRASAVHTISRFLAAWAKDMGVQVEPFVLPNGVDVAAFSKKMDEESRRSERASEGYTNEQTVLITAGRLSHKNAVDDLIRAVAKLPERYRLLLPGAGEDEEMLRTLSRELGVENRVRFVGYVDHKVLPSLLAICDIFVRPSRSEGLGNAFLEAMAAELPVIGTPVGGIPDFLLDGETGIFCRPDDPESIAEAVRRLDDASLRAKIIDQGKRMVEQKYDWDKIAERMKAFLLHV